MEQITTRRIEILGKEVEGIHGILTPEALDFVASLHYLFDNRRKNC